MKEQVSALMDGEFDGLDCDGCINRLKQDPAAREVWDIYHLIGDSLRGHVGVSLPASFAERLAQEPTVLAPRRRMSQRHPAWFALSAAASVAAVVAVGWMALPMITQPQPTPVAQAPATLRLVQPTQMLSVAPAAVSTGVVANVTPVAGDISDYLIAHQRFTPTSAMVGVAPYARTVSQDLEKR